MCGCQGAQEQKTEPTFVVTLPNGTSKEVIGEYAAKVEVTVAGGGSYRQK